MPDPTPAHTPEPETYRERPIEPTYFADHLPNAGHAAALYVWGVDDANEPTVEICDFTKSDAGKEETLWWMHRIVACVNACAGMTNPAEEIASLRASVKSLNDELLRVRTSQHGAAHAIDNIATECGLEDRSILAVQTHVRDLRRDAERYRKFRSAMLGKVDTRINKPQDWVINVVASTVEVPSEADFDAAIDAIGGGE